MNTGEDVFRQLQSLARSHADRTGAPAPTTAYLTRHALESFLDRLTRTPHGRGFVLKGGVLLDVYGVRRATRDIDSEAIGAALTAQELTAIVTAVAAVPAGDGVDFDLTTLTAAPIRDDADYPGQRIRVKATIGHQAVTIVWDISTGDPIVPPPRTVALSRLLGDPIHLLGYAPETTVAEKGVTILERGTTSTRWRDYVDIVQLAAWGLDPDLLASSVRAVAGYRQVQLRPIAPLLAGYGALAQTKWAAWRRKENLQDISEELLDDQIALVAAVLDPAVRPQESGRRGPDSS